MDIERRRSLAAALAAILPEVEQAIVDSWPQLLPSTSAWSSQDVLHARRAARAALDALAGVLAQGDLDDRTWQRIRAEVTGHGRVALVDVDELLRTVRVVGVELLTDRLRDTVGLSNDERWALQAQAGWLLDHLAGNDEEVDARHVADLLAELHRHGPDVG